MVRLALLCLASLLLAALAAGPVSAHGPHGHAHLHHGATPAAAGEAAVARGDAAAAALARPGDGDHGRGCADHGARCCSTQCCTGVAIALPVPAIHDAAPAAATEPALVEQPPDAPLATHLRPPSL